MSEDQAISNVWAENVKLRDERDRLNIAMAQATMALRYYAKTAISFRAVEALDKIEAALTPAGGGQNGKVG